MDLSPKLVRDARSRLDGIAVRTPLLRFSGSVGNDGIWLKAEIFQPIGSFKLRGAYNALTMMNEATPLTAASTISTGNMAQAVAWSAARLGIPATAIMPESAPDAKINAVRAYGAEIEFIPRDQLFLAMEDGRYDDRPGFVHPFRDSRVSAGAGTIGLEILDDLPDTETIFAPVGGGGLLTGVATAVKAVNPNVRVIGVEPEGCCAVARSLAAGSPQEMECTSFVDSAGAPFIFPDSFERIKRLADDDVTVPDEATKAAIYQLATRNKLVVEGAGALSVAAAIATPPEQRGPTVCILSGGSINPGQLAEILTEHSAMGHRQPSE